MHGERARLRAGILLGQQDQVDAVAPLALGRVEPLVGDVVELLEGELAVEHGAAHAGRELVAQPGRRERDALDGGADALGDAGGAAGIGIRQEDAELLAAHAPDQVDVAHGLAQGARDEHQRLVAAVVAEAVVDVLEMVDVDDEQRPLGRRLALLHALEIALHHGVEGAPVEQRGERIGGRHVHELVMGDGELAQLRQGEVQQRRGQHQRDDEVVDAAGGPHPGGEVEGIDEIGDADAQKRAERRQQVDPRLAARREIKLHARRHPASFLLSLPAR